MKFGSRRPAGHPNPFGCGGQKKQGFVARIHAERCALYRIVVQGEAPRCSCSLFPNHSGNGQRVRHQQGLHFSTSSHLRVRWLKALAQFSPQYQRTRHKERVFQIIGPTKRSIEKGVADGIVAAIRSHERNGLVELPKPPRLKRGDRVQIVRGPFREHLALYVGKPPLSASPSCCSSWADNSGPSCRLMPSSRSGVRHDVAGGRAELLFRGRGAA
jgi:hypothetical protein